MLQINRQAFKKSLLVFRAYYPIKSDNIHYKLSLICYCLNSILLKCSRKTSSFQISLLPLNQQLKATTLQMTEKHQPIRFELYAAIIRPLEDSLLRLVEGRERVPLILTTRTCFKRVKLSCYSKSLVLSFLMLLGLL